MGLPGLWSSATHCNAAGLAESQYQSCALLLLVCLLTSKEMLFDPDRLVMRGVSLIYGFIPA